MSIVKPYTFTAGTKARANEVNQDFDTLYQQVNTNITGIEEANDLIENLEATKAEIAGSSSQTFSVKDPTSDYHAVNKKSLFNYIGNSVDIITGFVISKDTSATNKIIISAGSCYDNNRKIVLKSTDSMSVENTNQSAYTTYYVYVIGNDDGSLVKGMISTQSPEPNLPEGYTLYRKIGYYVTGDDKSIDSINNESSSSEDGKTYVKSTKSISSVSSTSLKAYLPYDNSIYLCWLYTYDNEDKAGNTSRITYVTTDIFAKTAINCLDRDAGRNTTSCNLVVVPVGKSRTITMSVDTGKGDSYPTFTLLGYMKA